MISLDLKIAFDKNITKTESTHTEKSCHHENISRKEFFFDEEM